METKIKTAEVKADAANGSITGYAATWTRTPDSYGDVIAKGAFADSIERIKSEGKAIPLLWNHDSYDLKSFIGTVTDLEEDEHGLKFTATFDGTERAQRARELASDGRLCKFSFAYNVLDAGTVTLEDGTEANELRKLDLFEVSLVMYPANPDTSVVEVKADKKNTVNVVGVGVMDQADIDAISRAFKRAAAEMKAGRRNSKKDADALKSVLEKLSEIQSIVNGLLESELSDEQEAEAEADEAKANAEEPRGANAEEPEAKGADVDALLQQATEILTTKEG
jgi:HK97 family phage prohead protease